MSNLIKHETFLLHKFVVYGIEQHIHFHKGKYAFKICKNCVKNIEYTVHINDTCDYARVELIHVYITCAWSVLILDMQLTLPLITSWLG